MMNVKRKTRNLDDFGEQMPFAYQAPIDKSSAFELPGIEQRKSAGGEKSTTTVSSNGAKKSLTSKSQVRIYNASCAC